MDQTGLLHEAPVLPQLVDNISHNLTPSHFYLVNTALRVWENNSKCLSHYKARLWLQLSLLRRQMSCWEKSEIFSLLTPKLVLIFHVSAL